MDIKMQQNNINIYIYFQIFAIAIKFLLLCAFYLFLQN